jgi:hypothetical protein
VNSERQADVLAHELPHGERQLVLHERDAVLLVLEAEEGRAAVGVAAAEPGLPDEGGGLEVVHAREGKRGSARAAVHFERLRVLEALGVVEAAAEVVRHLVVVAVAATDLLPEARGVQAHVLRHCGAARALDRVDEARDGWVDLLCEVPIDVDLERLLGADNVLGVARAIGGRGGLGAHGLLRADDVRDVVADLRVRLCVCAFVRS